MKTAKEHVFEYFEDMVSDMLYYDRKYDEALPVGYIEDAIKRGEFTVEEFVNRFSEVLTDNLNRILEDNQ